MLLASSFFLITGTGLVWGDEDDSPRSGRNSCIAGLGLIALGLTIQSFIA